MKQKIETELNHCLDALASLEPSTEEYTRVLSNLNMLVFTSREFGLGGRAFLPPTALGGTCPEDKSAPDYPEEENAEVEGPDNSKEADPATEADPVPETETAPEKPDVKYEKSQVREALANARLRGLDVAKLIHGVGASSLSGVDPARYGELMDALAKALEELG